MSTTIHREVKGLAWVAWHGLGAGRHACKCSTLCDLMDCSPPGSSLHRILQARILEWVAILFVRGSSRPRDQAHISCRWIFYHRTTR